MGNCWKQYAKDYLWNQIGETCGKYSKYAEEMDAIHYYNYAKNGVANSCALFCDNALLHACTDPSYDEDPECAKYTALNAMYEPQSAGANAGAGCVQKVGYFKRAGAWYTDTADFCELDEIFFASSDYANADNPDGIYHTGMIVDWGYIEELGTDGFTVIEGNTNGGVVAYKYYAYSDPRIYGAGRPLWDGWTPEDSATQTENPIENSEPEPTSDYEKRTVCVNTYLAIRTEPEYKADDSNKIGELYNGATVYIFETRDDWARIGDNMWVSIKYLR